MSDNHHVRISPPLGEVEHVKFLSEHIGALYQNDEYSDVTLIVENERFKGHKVILAARSEYFRALLFGGLKESQQSEIELKDASLVSFKVLLKYIYTGHMTLTNLKEEVILDILGLAHQYGFVDLENAILDYLKAILNSHNVCPIFDFANFYQLKCLVCDCCSYMDRHAWDIIHHDSFLHLSASALKEVISRDSFCAPEVDIFRAIIKWKVRNPNNTNDDLNEIMGAVRLTLMTLQDLLIVVRPSGLVSADVILDAIKTQHEIRDIELRYRGFLLPEENVASPKHGAQVLHGEMKTALLDGDVQNYDMERGFTRHTIVDNGQGILVKLGMECIINHVRMLLWDRDMRSYSYFIEVSMNQKDWVRVVDHNKYLCRSWQTLYFPARVVKYIRIVGTHNTVNRVFHVVSFECMYTNRSFKLENGLIVPSENVATVQASASVTEGVSRSRNALLNGDTKNYDWDSGYTCHQLGSGAIVVQLAQPYMLDYFRLLLWDCDDRSYSYYIEVSIDQQNWEHVVDRTEIPCRSWQIIRFKRRPITFIRIVGTRNTANEVFHCVHFECSSQEPSANENENVQRLSKIGFHEDMLETSVSYTSDKQEPFEEKT